MGGIDNLQELDIDCDVLTTFGGTSGTVSMEVLVAGSNSSALQWECMAVLRGVD